MSASYSRRGEPDWDALAQSSTASGRALAADRRLEKLQEALALEGLRAHHGWIEKVSLLEDDRDLPVIFIGTRKFLQADPKAPKSKKGLASWFKKTQPEAAARLEAAALEGRLDFSLLSRF